MASIETSKSLGTYVDPGRSRVMLGEWARIWLQGQTQLKPTARERYEGVIPVHIDPTWAHVPLAP